MPSFHHVNLGVPPAGIEAESAFLLDVLGYRILDPGEEMQRRGAHWFEAEDGSQVHLSEDPDHRPAARAHVAVAYGPQLAEVRDRLARAACEFAEFDLPGGGKGLFCQDPSGNRWELRG